MNFSPKTISLTVLSTCFLSFALASQQQDSNFIVSEVHYSSSKEYVLAGIEFEGNNYYDKDLLISMLGMRIGDIITIPGPKISSGVRKLWAYGLYSDIQISIAKQTYDKVWLKISLTEQPRLSAFKFIGLRKGLTKEITDAVKLTEGAQITSHMKTSLKRLVEAQLKAKGYEEAEVTIRQEEDTVNLNSAKLFIHVDKHQKTKIRNVHIEGNKEISTGALERAMKKTKARKLKHFFRSKKFIEEKYKEDKVNLVKKFNSKGYRDAYIISDTIERLPTRGDKVRVNIFLKVHEGSQYFFGNIDWVGNSKFKDEELAHVLKIEKGELFSDELLSERLNHHETGVMSIFYQNNGYLFSRAFPVESTIRDDTIDMEIRIFEGRIAKINQVKFTGNDKVRDHVIVRELRTKPGDRYSQQTLIRSIRELGALRIFDQNIQPDLNPNEENGTVDITYKLLEAGGDQITLQGAWGGNTFIGTLGLKLSNFSARDILRPERWRPFPHGDGQQLSLNLRSNGEPYQSYSISFTEPWLGGKRPNSLSISLYYNRESYSQNSSSGYNSAYYQGYGYSQTDYITARAASYIRSDFNSERHIFGASASLGLRLKVPDDFFFLQFGIDYRSYYLKNSNYYGIANGLLHELAGTVAFGRNSIFNPIYPQSGSQLTLSGRFTPPRNLFSPVDLSDPDLAPEDRYKWIESYKIKFSANFYMPLDRTQKLVLRMRFEAGLLGAYSDNLVPLFGRFVLGGTGSPNYSLASQEIIGLRGYPNYSLSPGGFRGGSYVFDRLTMELRYPLIMKPTSTIYGLAFAEGGNSWLSPSRFNISDMKRSVGIGMRFYLPIIGLLGIDWGYGFDIPDYGTTKGGSQFHFILGYDI